MTITVKISNPDIRGVAGERRVTALPIDSAGKVFELVCPRGWFPHARANVARKWEIVFSQTIGTDQVWRSIR